MPVAFDRTAMLERLAGETFDVLVIGGGVTGAGVALDAASRGLRTALVEADDFASGTSSKSSKLVHGGLRYLQNRDVRLVYQALRERKRLRHNAPHLVKILPFLIPIMTKDGLLPRRVARALGGAMWMYDLTGGWRIGKLHRRLKADAAFAHLPTLHRDRVAGGYLYYDATVDDARLVLTLVQTAADHGAAVANRCPVVALNRGPDGAVTGARVDPGGDGAFDIRATVVVSATGVWADELRAMEGAGDGRSIRPAKGVHVTVPWELVRNDIAAVIPVPGDKRSLFVVPWGARPDGTFAHTYIGTTDTDYDGPLDDPPCTGDDIDYVLGAVNAALDPATSGPITREQITGVWAGLRPLVRSAVSARTADLSRQHHVDVGPGGVVSIAGGKLTTYREMAEDTVDTALARLGRKGRCRTRSLLLRGADGYVDSPPGTRDAHLADRYGSGRSAIDALIAADASLGAPLVEGLPYERAEAVHAVRAEMATTLTDVLTRRTRAHLLDRAATLTAAPAVAELLAGELGWDADETARQLADYVALAEHEQAEARERAVPGEARVAEAVPGS